MIQDVPFNRHIGLELVSRDETSAEIRCPIQPWFAQEAGVVHGGVLGAIADTASAYAVGPTARIGVEYKISFLRSADMTGEPLVARGRVVRRGKRVSVAVVDVFQGEAHLATGLFTYLMQ